MNLDNRIKYILLNKNLIKILNLNKKKNIILYDAVDVRDFKNLHNDKIKNSCYMLVVAKRQRFGNY